MGSTALLPRVQNSIAHALSLSGPSFQVLTGGVEKERFTSPPGATSRDPKA